MAANIIKENYLNDAHPSSLTIENGSWWRSRKVQILLGAACAITGAAGLGVAVAISSVLWPIAAVVLALGLSIFAYGYFLNKGQTCEVDGSDMSNVQHLNETCPKEIIPHDEESPSDLPQVKWPLDFIDDIYHEDFSNVAYDPESTPYMEANVYTILYDAATLNFREFRTHFNKFAELYPNNAPALAQGVLKVIDKIPNSIDRSDLSKLNRIKKFTLKFIPSDMPVRAFVPSTPTTLLAKLVEEETSKKTLLTAADKVLGVSNAVQWGLVTASLCGVGTAITTPIATAASIGSAIATYCMWPEDASIVRKAMLMATPLALQKIAQINPIVKGVAQTHSLYTLAKNSGPKLKSAYEEFSSDPVNAVKTGAVHLFNLASGIAFSAESAGLINLRQPAQNEKIEPPVKQNSDSPGLHNPPPSGPLKKEADPPPSALGDMQEPPISPPDPFNHLGTCPVSMSSPDFSMEQCPKDESVQNPSPERTDIFALPPIAHANNQVAIVPSKQFHDLSTCPANFSTRSPDFSELLQPRAKLAPTSLKMQKTNMSEVTIHEGIDVLASPPIAHAGNQVAIVPSKQFHDLSTCPANFSTRSPNFSEACHIESISTPSSMILLKDAANVAKDVAIQVVAQGAKFSLVSAKVAANLAYRFFQCTLSDLQTKPKIQSLSGLLTRQVNKSPILETSDNVAEDVLDVYGTVLQSANNRSAEDAHNSLSNYFQEKQSELFKPNRSNKITNSSALFDDSKDSYLNGTCPNPHSSVSKPSGLDMRAGSSNEMGKANPTLHFGTALNTQTEEFSNSTNVFPAKDLESVPPSSYPISPNASQKEALQHPREIPIQTKKGVNDLTPEEIAHCKPSILGGLSSLWSSGHAKRKAQHEQCICKRKAWHEKHKSDISEDTLRESLNPFDCDPDKLFFIG